MFKVYCEHSLLSFGEIKLKNECISSNPITFGLALITKLSCPDFTLA